MPPIRVLHLIPHLGQGGAEASLAALLGQNQPGVDPAVCTMIEAPQHFAVEAPLFAGTGRRGVPSPALALHLRRAVRAFRPDILHCWMYHANLLSLSTAGSGVPVIWSLHESRPDRLGSRQTRLVNAACAHLSRLVPERILYVAESARARHEALGYAADRGLVIPNGIDLRRFRREAARTGGAPLRIGMVARYDPAVKGHHFLVEVLARHPLRSAVELVFAGEGCDTAPALRDHLESAGLLGRSRLHGALGQIERIYEDLDILVLPSRAEALPMVVLEAAAMGVMVCASRVGDVPRIGLPAEVLFDPDDAEGCARALSAAAALAAEPGRAARQRALVQDRFDVERIARRLADLYHDVVERPAARACAPAE